MIRHTTTQRPVLAVYSRRRSYFIEPFVRHQEHELNMAMTGSGVYTLDDGRTMELKAGEILLLPAGAGHAIEVVDNLYMAIIHFHPQVFEAVKAGDPRRRRLLKRLKGWVDPPEARKRVDPDAHAALEGLTEDAVVEQNRRDPGYETILQAIATQAAVHFLRLMTAPEATGEMDETTRRILTVRRWIDRHFSEPCGVESLAAMARLAPTYFAACFTRIVGRPPMAYVRRRRLEQAQHLLASGAQAVKVIAWSVGFADLSHFNHAFKKAYGCSPAAFRRAARGSD